MAAMGKWVKSTALQELQKKIKGDAKMTIAEKVKENLEHLLTLDQPGLTRWAKGNEMDNRAAFGAYKKALLANGIDFDKMRNDRINKAHEETAAAVTHTVVLFSDAKAREDRYAICNKDGEPIWHGKFFADDRDYNGEQSSGELAAAKKAVWLASKIAAAVNGKVKLILKIDAQWLTWANEKNGSGGKAKELSFLADKLGILLTVEHIAGTSNPADKYTVCSGFKKWQETNLSDLAIAV